MYTRSYFGEGSERISVPENYDGIAFDSSEDAPKAPTDTLPVSSEPNRNPWEQMPPPPPPDKPPEEKGDGIFASLTKSPVFSNVFKNTPFLSSIKIPTKLGLEELLIIGAAAFLFFTKDGDRECALILLLLLLIN